ncbi:YcxB family protein [Streptomyces sp. NPDC047928]|uniref:YcxB family protein n=1 Tax=unclassified Streptomyces TaxID=2593676 RepID=UPI003710CC69
MTTEARTDGRAVERVELVYLPTATDMRTALRARMRGTPSGRRTRRLLLAGGTLGVLLLAVLLALPGEPRTSSLLLTGGLAVWSYAAPPLIVRVQARQVQRMVEPQGEHRAVADDSGVRWTTRDQDVSITWRALPRFIETPGLFVLLTRCLDRDRGVR